MVVLLTRRPCLTCGKGGSVRYFGEMHLTVALFLEVFMTRRRVMGFVFEGLGYVVDVGCPVVTLARAFDFVVVV
jgi:hypothetical protein